MAAAEARTAWQRAANRCFVQEDAKRAPKLACCQSSSSSSKQVEAGPTSAADGSDHPCIGFMPFSRKASYSNLPPDAKWWLQVQPNHGHQRGLTCEQLTSLEVDMETSGTSILNIDSKTGDKSTGVIEPSLDVSTKKRFDKSTGVIEPSLDVSTKKSFEATGEQLYAASDNTDQDILELRDMTDYYEFMEVDLAGSSASKQSSESFGVNSPWIGVEKVPWWQTTDRDELASLVAQKSLNHIENCDLPPPQKIRVRRECYRDNSDKISASSQDWEGHSQATSGISSGHSPNSVAAKRRHYTTVEEGQSENVASKPLSTNYEDLTDKARTYDNDQSKAQLLEALCHSQTRAREAERAAKQAYAEKEHVVKLFFKQASHLFAYKQWFRLLQLQSCLQINDKHPATSTLFPVLLPWMPYKPRKLRKNWQKSAKARRRKRSLPRYDICKYAVAFAVGLSLVGAGLLLGWTVGWLFPTL